MGSPSKMYTTNIFASLPFETFNEHWARKAVHYFNEKQSKEDALRYYNKAVKEIEYGNYYIK